MGQMQAHQSPEGSKWVKMGPIKPRSYQMGPIWARYRPAMPVCGPYWAILQPIVGFTRPKFGPQDT
jgi:hypothetical protein